MSGNRSATQRYVPRDRRRIAGYFLDLAERAEPMLRTAEQLDRLELLDAHEDDLNAALRRTVSEGRADPAVRMVAARTWAWTMRGQRHEAARWASEVLELAGPTAGPGVETAHALCVLAATDCHEPVRARAMELLATVAHPGLWLTASAYQGDPVAVHDRLMATAARFEVHQDPWQRAAAPLLRAVAEFEFGGCGPGSAERHLHDAVAAFRTVGDRCGLLLAEYELSMVLADSRDGAVRATALEGLAEWYLDAGDPNRAADLLDQALVLRGIRETADPELRELLRRAVAAVG